MKATCSNIIVVEQKIETIKMNTFHFHFMFSFAETYILSDRKGFHWKISNQL